MAAEQVVRRYQGVGGLGQTRGRTVMFFLVLIDVAAGGTELVSGLPRRFSQVRSCALPWAGCGSGGSLDRVRSQAVEGPVRVFWSSAATRAGSGRRG
ncbi:MAG TPA: hypothetical protein VN969_00190 [Streptosporangiaceae bacterium]|nr:hypothetical protein [Streptosporangiaceae bacterium]